MGHVISDIKTAVKLTRKIRETRKAGADGAKIEIKPLYERPVLNIPYWSFTPEACILHGLYGDLGRAVADVFNSFDEETQKGLTFIPKTTQGFTERARFWQQKLKPILTPEQYYEAIFKILDWCIRCVKGRGEKEATGENYEK